MIDFHSHILPGIDDGSRDINMTKALLREERKQGVDLIAATPHFYANRMSVDRFLERRSEAMKETECLRREADEPLPELIAGAEIYYFEGIGCAKDLIRLCADGTRTILLEMPFLQWNEIMLKDIENIILQQKIDVVLAHIERYRCFQKDRNVWNRVLELPLTPQINAGSFLKKRKLFSTSRERQFCMDFVSGHSDVILGSDCHNMEDRAPNLAAARTEIEKTLGREALIRIDEMARKALTFSSA